MAEIAKEEPQAPNNDNQPVAPDTRPGRVPAIVVFALALVASGAAGLYALPKYDLALQNFRSLADLFPGEVASAPIPDPVVTALKDIQSTQQQNAAALQENGAVLKQNAARLLQDTATLDFLRQNFPAQQADLKRISSQLSSLTARVEFLQNAVAPLTTSSIPQSKVRARGVRTSTRKVSRLPRPLGPVSVGGAPLSFPVPTAGSALDRT